MKTAKRIFWSLLVLVCFIYFVFFGLETLLKRHESRKYEEEKRNHRVRKQILDNATQNKRVMKWAENEVSPKKLRELKNRHRQNIEVAAIQHDSDPKLIESIVVVESGGNEKAVSPANAIGLMGVKQIAARDADTDPKNLKDPLYNLLIGSKYLKLLETRYGFRRLDARLIAYNRGPTAARVLLDAGYSSAKDHYVQKVYLVLAELEKPNH